MAVYSKCPDCGLQMQGYSCVNCLSAEVERLKNACSQQQNEIQTTLAKALGYEEVNGLPTYGDHVAESLAMECARKIGELTNEVARLKRGEFTPEELQNLCHNLTAEDACAFKRGCELEQIKLFGRIL